MADKKIIIDLCAGTGAWSRPYEEDDRYVVLKVTYPHNDVKVWQAYKDLPNVHGILAAPTCTHFSLARTTAKTPRDLEGAFELVGACLNIVRYCRYHKGLKFWALENPVGYLRQLMGKPPLTFNPCDYAGWADDPAKEGYTKKTDLWGYYNMPKLKPVELTEQQMRDCSINNRILPQIPEGYEMPQDLNAQAVRRSITPQGFARAFYRANK